ncbi:MAG: phenylacetate--CoA ligase family protein, partial [Acidobacteriota bacterium]
MVRDHHPSTPTQAAPRAEADAPADLAQLRALVAELLEHNAFWSPRLRRAGLDRGVDSLAHFSRALPPVEKDELIADQREHPPYGRNLTYPLDRYIRLHQTSGTSGGTPLRFLDTPESWSAQLA